MCWWILSKDDSDDEGNQYTTSIHEYQEDEFGSTQRHEANSLDSTANISVLAETGFAEASSLDDRSMVMSKVKLLSFLVGPMSVIPIINCLFSVRGF